jgi:hypothetical protein
LETNDVLNRYIVKNTQHVHHWHYIYQGYSFRHQRMTTIVYIGGERQFLQQNQVAHRLPRVLQLFLGRDYIGAGFNGYAKYVSLYAGEGSYVDEVDANLSPFAYDVGFRTLIPLNKDINEHEPEAVSENEAREWEADTQSSEPSTESSETDTYSRASESYSYYTTTESEEELQGEEEPKPRRRHSSPSPQESSTEDLIPEGDEEVPTPDAKAPEPEVPAPIPVPDARKPTPAAPEAPAPQPVEEGSVPPSADEDEPVPS